MPKLCRMCDNPDCEMAFAAMNDEGETRYICTDCCSAMEAIMQKAREEGVVLDHFHAGEEKDIASDVAEFFSARTRLNPDGSTSV